MLFPLFTLLIGGRPSVMELGGKSPAIVMPSADLKLAANNVCLILPLPLAPWRIQKLIEADPLRRIPQFGPDMHVYRKVPGPRVGSGRVRKGSEGDCGGDQQKGAI